MQGRARWEPWEKCATHSANQREGIRPEGFRGHQTILLFIMGQSARVLDFCLHLPVNTVLRNKTYNIGAIGWASSRARSPTSLLESGEILYPRGFGCIKTVSGCALSNTVCRNKWRVAEMRIGFLCSTGDCWTVTFSRVRYLIAYIILRWLCVQLISLLITCLLIFRVK